MEQVIIYEWMVDDLNIGGRKLLTFAKVFNDAQGKNKCILNIDFMCKFLDCTKPTALKIISELITDKLIIEKEGKYTYVKSSIPELIDLKSKKAKKFIAPDWDQFSAYLEQYNTPKDVIEKRFKYFESLGWLDYNTEPMFEWKIECLITDEYIEAYNRFNYWIDVNVPNVRKIKKQITLKQYVKLKLDYGSDVIKKVIVSKLESLHNTPKYWEAKSSAKKFDVYLTMLNWMKMNGQKNKDDSSSISEKLKSAFSHHE